MEIMVGDITKYSQDMRNTKFAELFKRYRLRSEISTLTQFGDLLAEEGFIYESSIFSRWQKGNRVPTNRKILLAMLRVFIKKDAIKTAEEANIFLETAEHGYMTEKEMNNFTPMIGMKH